MALSDTFTTLGNTIINLVTGKITKALSDLTLYLGVYGGRATYTVKYINLISDPITTTATVTTTVTDMETRTKYVFDDYISYNTDSTLVFISDFNIGALFTPEGSVPSEIYNVIITDNEGISAELDHSKFIDNLEDYSDTGVVCYSLNPYKISAGKGRAVKSIEYVVTSQDAPEYGKSAVISEIQMYVDSNWFPNQ